MWSETTAGFGVLGTACSGTLLVRTSDPIGVVTGGRVSHFRIGSGMIQRIPVIFLGSVAPGHGPHWGNSAEWDSGRHLLLGANAPV